MKIMFNYEETLCMAECHAALNMNKAILALAWLPHNTAKTCELLSWGEGVLVVPTVACKIISLSQIIKH